jgi:hypothetical protein
MAADAILAQQQLNPHLSNWTAPLIHLVRHTLELGVKALLQAVALRSKEQESKLLFSHDLARIWETAKDWLIKNGHRIQEDARLETAEWLITNLHEIDPLGDLLRFGISKERAFGKQKNYDRVGIDIEVLIPDFNKAIEFLNFWESVIIREIIVAEMGWEKDPDFDPNDFPRAG